MKTLSVITILLMATADHAQAATLYVNLNSTNPTPPYTNWTSAATNIQDAINVSTNGDLILVTNGVYQTGSVGLLFPPPPVGGPATTESNRVAVTRAIMLQSVNGAVATIIRGYQVPGATFGTNAVRCIYLTNGASLSGFTLMDGATRVGGSGGGIFCSSNATIYNCIISGNAAYEFGGGVYGGTLSNCTLVENFATNGGGAASGTLDSCLVISNYAFKFGGGTCSNTSITCTLLGNASGSGGGGAAFGTLDRCMLEGNSATNAGGGAFNSTLNDCILTANSASYGGGASGGTLDNCTIVSNTASGAGGGVDSLPMYVNNCIVYYNTAPTQPNWYLGALNYCCTTPLPGSGVGNITDEPAFVNLSGGDFRLQANSPCINSGSNAYVTAVTDLDGNARIVGGTVDVGAYEYQGNIRYVSLSSSNPIAPYSDWSIAATNIQDAIDASSDGDLILVTNGVYQTGGRVLYGSLTNRVVINKAVTVQSVHGPAATTISGDPNNGSGFPTNGNNSVRCVYLTNNAALIGFTLAFGATRSAGDAYKEQSGGGAWCEGTNVLIANCILATNSAQIGGGGVYSGSLSNCLLVRNKVMSGGGGGAVGGFLVNCTLAGNIATNSEGLGGGAWVATLNNCWITNNDAVAGGGVAVSILNNCLLTGNGVANLTSGGAAYLGTLNNCTIVGNYSRGLGAADGCTLNNSIIYYNSGNGYADCYQCRLTNCCTPSLVNNGMPISSFTNAPVFVNPAGGDYHLQSNSPCINGGTNVYAFSTSDLDGNPRIEGGAVDMGAYEYQSPGFTLPYLWAKKYGVATDGSLDSDGDGLNNWQEWIAETNPTNALSVLKMLVPNASNGPAGVVVMWQSVANVTYFLQRDSSLTVPFSSVQSNIVGQAGTTSYTDTTATNSGPYFYRVGVRQ